MIPFLDLRGQLAGIRPEIDTALARVLDSGQFVLGDEVAAFEREFAAYCGGGEAVAVNSGTSALHLALLAAGVGPGDEVITVPFTFIATVSAIVQTGATPRLVDIDPAHFTMDPAALEAAITPRTRALIPVHLYGQPADMEPLLAVARRHCLVVIEDAAQAHGAEYHGRRCGSIGDIAAFSFYPAKNLGAYGEGGAVVTTSPEYAATVRMLRDWGQARKYEHRSKGFNCRMDAFQGAILRVKLRHLDRWTEARRTRAAFYGRLLSDSPLRLPVERAGCRHVYHLYTVRVADRDRFQACLRERGVDTGMHYPIPVHLQPAHADLGYRRGEFPESEQAAAEVLSLPMFAELTDGQVEAVAAAVGACARQPDSTPNSRSNAGANSDAYRGAGRR
ncbi:MAG TPA: DegT/DnrJ/EryC1/StrS family aminotransferase [Vicinamibacterales bacterium]